MDITVGTKVRSFDFDGRDLEGERACYAEGKVVGFEKLEGCERYVIEVTRRVFGGDEDDRRGKIYPPVNGTPTWMGRVTDGVEVI